MSAFAPSGISTELRRNPITASLRMKGKQVAGIHAGPAVTSWPDKPKSIAAGEIRIAGRHERRCCCIRPLRGGGITKAPYGRYPSPLPQLWDFVR